MNSQSSIREYIDKIENNFIISKTDAKAIITYANDTFCKLS